MSTMLIVGLLIATILVVFVDAGSWKLHIQEVKRVQRNNTLGPLNDVYSEVLDFGRDKYRATVYVGSPPQPFHVTVDTGSNILWVPKKGCKATGEYLIGNCKSSKYVYNPRGSATGKNLNQPFRIAYGDGSATITGHYYRDVFSFGEKMRLKEPITFGVGEEMKHRDQGILGLGNAVNSNEHGTSILHEAWRQKLIDAPIFTMYLRKCPRSEDCEKHGTITIGSYDKEMCGKIEGHVKFSTRQCSCKSIFQSNNGLGRASIYIPSNYYKPLMEAIKASLTDKGRYVVDCDAYVAISLRINGIEYVIPGNQVLVNLHTNYCLLRIYPFDFDNGTWLLGNPFGTTYCQTHNIETQTIEFAPALTRYD
ncbi:Aspartic protease 6 [Aphelenchoides besseyi]|nr:Aspartic protease 6 [Aphelenchoides besseyi]